MLYIAVCDRLLACGFPILQWKTTVSRVLGVEGYSTYFYILAFFKAKWLTAHGTRQLQIFQVAYARFPDKA